MNHDADIPTIYFKLLRWHRHGKQFDGIACVTELPASSLKIAIVYHLLIEPSSLFASSPPPSLSLSIHLLNLINRHIFDESAEEEARVRKVNGSYLGV